jgi:hypothetical protein
MDGSMLTEPSIPSPTEAARTITGNHVSGWTFFLVEIVELDVR